ncbi:hypothetical protein BS47DRAFT_1485126 [Hydnum rufescens UP504]|uniref:Uncharacterized protein n=1 Tax=Hydnum rufescens UP504 TaxID=1448309 RepID=A0A9P6DXZ9_9AGAM|nr:hypothetical protein BS47DRAFT_1485126 [Hydnum rufescens UP504]
MFADAYADEVGLSLTPYILTQNRHTLPDYAVSPFASFRDLQANSNEFLFVISDFCSCLPKITHCLERAPFAFDLPVGDIRDGSSPGPNDRMIPESQCHELYFPRRQDPRSFRKDITLDFAMIPLASPPPDACAPEEVFVNSAIAYMAKKPGIAEFYYNRGGDPTADERRLDSIPQGPLAGEIVNMLASIPAVDPALTSGYG